MPYCSRCGSEVDARDVYCAHCGARQPVNPAPQPRPSAEFEKITPRTASILCYVPGLGWLASILVLASQRFRQNRPARFHAFQGLYLFVAWLIEEWVLHPILSSIPGIHMHGILQATLLVMSIFMMVKASHGEMYSLPIFGELAERSLAEE